MLGEKAPVEADPSGTWYAFEKGAKKAGGGDGWADVWKRKHLGCEYKGPGRNLDEAFKQLQIYTPSLEYPPLLIVSDIQTIRIHTAFTGLLPVIHELKLEDVRDHAKRRLLKWAFTNPDQLRPRQTHAELTEAAAGRLGDLAHVWRSRGHEPLLVAHFRDLLGPDREHLSRFGGGFHTHNPTHRERRRGIHGDDERRGIRHSG